MTAPAFNGNAFSEAFSRTTPAGAETGAAFNGNAFSPGFYVSSPAFTGTAFSNAFYIDAEAPSGGKTAASIRDTGSSWTYNDKNRKRLIKLAMLRERVANEDREIEFLIAHGHL